MSTATTTPAAQLAAALASLLSSSMGATVDGQVVTLVAGDRTFVVAIAEKVADVCAGLKRRQTLSTEQGEQFPGSRNKCGQLSPRRDYECTRVGGHTGVHVATYSYGRGAEVCCDAWGGDPVVSGTDKYRDYREGMQIDPGDIGESGRRCRDNNGGQSCTLASGHSGVHVATVNRGRLTCDAWSNADKSDPFSTFSLRNSSNDPTEGPDEDDPCGHDIRGDECTREDGHSGNHVSGSGHGVRDWCRPGECG